MPLDRFVRANPDCFVAGPDVGGQLARLALSVAALGLSVVIGTLCLYHLFVAPGLEMLFGAVLCGLLGVGVGRAAARSHRRFQQALQLKRRGCLCYAIAETQCLLVDARGRANVVSIGSISHLDFDGQEPRLRIEADAPGRIYAALFDLFDGTLPGPRADRFVAVLAPRLRALRPEAASVG